VLPAAKWRNKYCWRQQRLGRKSNSIFAAPGSQRNARGVSRANGSYNRYRRQAGHTVRGILEIGLNWTGQAVDHFQWEGPVGSC
jgi:hypothetical protein